MIQAWYPHTVSDDLNVQYMYVAYAEYTQITTCVKDEQESG